MVAKDDLVKTFFEEPHLYLHKRFGIMIRIHILKAFLLKYKIKPQQVIDIGCGDGSIGGIFLANKETHVTFIDMADAMINLTKKKFEKTEDASFYVGDFMKLQFDSKYDFIIAIGLVAHLTDIGLFFNRLSHLLSKEGTVILQFSNQRSVTLKISSLFRQKTKYGLNQTRPADVYQLLAENGFEVVAKKRFLFYIPGMKFLSDDLLFKIQRVFMLPFLNPFTSDYMLLIKQKPNEIQK